LLQFTIYRIIMSNTKRKKLLKIDEILKFGSTIYKSGYLCDILFGVYFAVVFVINTIYYSFFPVDFAMFMIIWVILFLISQVLLQGQRKQWKRRNWEKRKELFDTVREIFLRSPDTILKEISINRWYKKAKIIDDYRINLYIFCYSFILFFILLNLILFIIPDLTFLKNIFISVFFPSYLIGLGLKFIMCFISNYVKRFQWFLIDIMRFHYEEVESLTNTIYPTPPDTTSEQFLSQMEEILNKIEVFYTLKIFDNYRSKIKYGIDLEFFKRYLKGKHKLNQKDNFDLIPELRKLEKAMITFDNKNKLALSSKTKERLKGYQNIIETIKNDLLGSFQPYHKEDEKLKKDQIKDLIDGFELDLRFYIKRKLWAYYKDDCLNKGIPSDTREVAEKRLRHERRIEPQRDYNLYDFLTLNDLKLIITKKNNWNNIFSNVFPEKHIVQTHLEKIVQIRNRVFHSRTKAEFLKDDLDFLKLSLKELKKYLD